MTPILAALFALTTAASAQDFNAPAPNAPGQVPAFAGQTRAPVLPADPLRTEVIARLDSPWGMAQLPGGGWIVTEKAGRIRIVAPDGTVSAPVSGVPPVDARRQGGLLDIALRADFDQTRRLWWSYAEPRDGGRNGTAVATGVLSPDGSALTGVRVIFRQDPAWASTAHYGSRLVFAPDGALFVTTGDRSVRDARPLAQDLTTHIGKVLRIDPEGGAAAGNPDLGGRAEIWSYGHRNIQGAAIGPDGALWTTEHGARGGDELNRPEGGRNYGWPVATYGIEYGGGAIGSGTAAAGMEQPLYYWDPVIAPSGLAFYEGALFPDWQGDALIGGLAGQALVRLTLDGTRVTGEARYLQGMARIRDVDVAPDGAILLLTDGPGGALVRVTPGGPSAGQ